MADEEFYLLKFSVRDLARRVSVLEATAKEIYGSVRELAGKVEVSLRHESIHEQIEEIRSVNMRQENKIGEIAGVLSHVISAMSRASDKTLAHAAHGLTINVSGGSSVGNTEGDAVVGTQEKS